MSTKGTLLSSQLMYTEKLVDQLQAENAIMLEALEAISQYIPNTSEAEGGAARFSSHVRAADKVRAALAAVKGVPNEATKAMAALVQAGRA